MSQFERRYTLKQAVDRFFPEGPLTVSSLRTEIRKGRLVVERIAGKIVVTEAAIGGMMERCREDQRGQGFTLEDVAAESESGSSSGWDLKKAQAAARATVMALKENSRVTSQPNTSRRKRVATSNVHLLRT